MAEDGNTAVLLFALAAAAVVTIAILFTFPTQLAALSGLDPSLFGATLAPTQPDPEEATFGPVDSAHEHAIFAVFLNGKQFDFSKAQYMSTNTSERSRFVHLHDGIGIKAHKHAAGVTWGYFFRTLGWSVNDTCITSDAGAHRCSSADNKLRFYLNGSQTDSIAKLEIRDDTRLLISYGTEAEVPGQLADLNGQADMISLKCRETSEEGC